MEQQCNSCNRIKPYESFYKSSIHKGGYHPKCIECFREYNRRRYKAKGKVIREYSRKYRERYPEYDRNYQRENPGNTNAKQAQRRARSKERTPAWVDRAALKEFYRVAQELRKATGIMYHVDHVIPLQHDLVCGLHVPENLQLLSETLNRMKNNRFDPDNI
jgi:hypothetical protein